MKIKTEDYKVLKDRISEFVVEHPECLKYKETVSNTRFIWDVLHTAKLMPFVCDTLYNYLNDVHIQNAVTKIFKEVTL